MKTDPVWLTPGRLCALLYGLAFILGLQQLLDLLPVAQWRAAFFDEPLLSSVREVIVHDMWLPRQLMALLCGMVLAFTGVVMQQVLRNPLAEPMTLGVASGATLSLMLGSILAPTLLINGREWVAFAGSLGAMAAVFMLSSRQAFSPLALILSGMLVNLYCGSVTLLLSIIYDRSLAAIFIWGGGSLVQQSSDNLLWLLPRLLVCLLPVLLLLRPLTLMTLNEQVTRSLGMSPTMVRTITLLAMLGMSSLVISSVGVIGFIGLAAPHLAALSGAKTLRQRMVWSPLIGAGLLWLTDQLVSRMSGINGMLLPTGMMTALAGGPLLLYFLPRVRNLSMQALDEKLGMFHTVAARPRFGLALVVLLISLAVSLDFGRSLQGWYWASWHQLLPLLPFRLPRMLAAMAAGVLLAGAGVLIQRITANPMASPELLGIGSGASLGITLMLLIAPLGGLSGILLSSSLGAFFTLLITLWIGRKSRFNPQRVILSGLAITAIFQSVAGVVMANDGQAGNMLRQLMTGSTYYVSTIAAVAAMLFCILLLSLTPLVQRYLLLLPLNDVALSLGVKVPMARIRVLILAAAMTGVATLIVGPLSFAGLLGPQIALRLGARKPLMQLFLAALVAAVLMVIADWMGRNLLYPRQIPAGLMATLLGGPWLMLLLYQKQHQAV